MVVKVKQTSPALTHKCNCTHLFSDAIIAQIFPFPFTWEGTEKGGVRGVELTPSWGCGHCTGGDTSDVCVVLGQEDKHSWTCRAVV